MWLRKKTTRSLLISKTKTFLEIDLSKSSISHKIKKNGIPYFLVISYDKHDNFIFINSTNL